MGIFIQVDGISSLNIRLCLDNVQAVFLLKALSFSIFSLNEVLQLSWVLPSLGELGYEGILATFSYTRPM